VKACGNCAGNKTPGQYTRHICCMFYVGVAALLICDAVHGRAVVGGYFQNANVEGFDGREELAPAIAPGGLNLGLLRVNGGRFRALRGGADASRGSGGGERGGGHGEGGVARGPRRRRGRHRAHGGGGGGG